MIAPAPRRLVSAAAVLLLHLGVITVLIITIRTTSNSPAATHEIEIVVSPPARKLPPPPESVAPQLIRPEMPKAIAPAIPPAASPGTAAAPAPGAISGVGRALFGCDAAKLDRLSTAARGACLRLPSGRPHEQSVRLGPPPDPNSPFTKEIEERFRQAQPINRPCPQGSYNESRGLPCFGFDQQSPLLQGR
ncbi:MAG: hypothetical protein ACREHF_04590 [Rhizomicrobium sp.]